MCLLKQYSIFILSGLLTSGIGEAINNFLIVWKPGNFVFAMMFYSITLTIAFVFYKKYFYEFNRTRLVTYIFLFGFCLGLIVNEWLLVGNHPGNPVTASLIAQISMISFHSLLYLIPLLVTSSAIHLRHRNVTLVKYVLLYVVFVVGVALFLGPPGVEHEYVLAWSIFFIYFIGYNFAFLYILWSLFGQTKKQF